MLERSFHNFHVVLVPSRFYAKVNCQVSPPIKPAKPLIELPPTSRSQTNKTSTMAINTSPKQHSKKVQIIYQSPTDCATRALSPKVPAQVPVFMLPQNDLLTIPEEAEIRLGFNVNMTLQPHQTRVFTGMMPMNNPDKEAIEQSATTNVEFRSYRCTKTIDKALAILKKARHMQADLDPQHRPRRRGSDPSCSRTDRAPRRSSDPCCTRDRPLRPPRRSSDPLPARISYDFDSTLEPNQYD